MQLLLECDFESKLDKYNHLDEFQMIKSALILSPMVLEHPSIPFDQ